MKCGAATRPDTWLALQEPWTLLPAVCRAPGRGRREVKICAVPRTMVVGGLAGLGLLLMYWSRALLTLAWALVLGERHA